MLFAQLVLISIIHSLLAPLMPWPDLWLLSCLLPFLMCRHFGRLSVVVALRRSWLLRHLWCLQLSCLQSGFHWPLLDLLMHGQRHELLLWSRRCACLQTTMQRLEHTNLSQLDLFKVILHQHRDSSSLIDPSLMAYRQQHLGHMVDLRLLMQLYQGMNSRHTDLNLATNGSWTGLSLCDGTHPRQLQASVAFGSSSRNCLKLLRHSSAGYSDRFMIKSVQKPLRVAAYRGTVSGCLLLGTKAALFQLQSGRQAEPVAPKYH